MLESRIQRNIIKKVEKLGGLAYKLHTNSVSGLPDLMILYEGFVFFVEVKQETGVVSKRQKYIHEKFRSVGHEVYILYDDKIEIILDKYQAL
jgi:hypothetical protein